MPLSSDQKPGALGDADAAVSGGVRIRHRVLQAGGWAMAGFAVEKGIGFLQLVVLTRLLLPGDFGLMAASAAVLLAIQTFSELGLEPAVIAKPEVTEEDLRVAWTLSVLRGCVLTVGLWGLADVIASALHIPELGVFLRVHAVGVLLQSLQSPALFILLKQLDLRRRVSFDLSRRLVETVVTIGLAWWWQSAWALLGGQLVAFLFGSLVSFWIAPCRIRWSLDRTALQSLWSYGRYQNVTAWFLFTVMSGSDFVVGRLQGVAGLGQYQLAMAIPTMIGIRAMSVMSQISLPTYALMQKDRPGVLRALSLQMSLTGMVVVPSAMGVAILAPYLVPFVFGPSWSAAIEPLRVLCLFAIAAAFCSVMAAFHCGANRPDLQTKIWAVMCACYVPMVITFTMTWGLVGAAWALALTFLVGLGLHLKATVQLLGRDATSAFEPLRWAGALVALVGCGVALSQAVPSMWMAQWLGALCGLAGVGVYGWHVWSRESLRLRMLWGS
ncbi:MAG: oligosaccharide flippase family protein [Nitrospira sp.]